jgi:hypothetical protein
MSDEEMRMLPWRVTINTANNEYELDLDNMTASEVVREVLRREPKATSVVIVTSFPE